jgi:hypothetical protein
LLDRKLLSFGHAVHALLLWIIIQLVSLALALRAIDITAMTSPSKEYEEPVIV